jgi:hypothetical protein
MSLKVISAETQLTVHCHYLYLVRQFDRTRTGKRHNADNKMVKQTQQLEPREVSAILDYTFRLHPPLAILAAPEWQNEDFPMFVRLDPPSLPGFTG